MWLVLAWSQDPALRECPKAEQPHDSEQRRRPIVHEGGRVVAGICAARTETSAMRTRLTDYRAEDADDQDVQVGLPVLLGP